MLQAQSIIYDQNPDTGLFERRKNQIDYNSVKRMPFLHLFDEREIRIINKVPGWISISFVGKSFDGKISTGSIVGQELKTYPNFYVAEFCESEKRDRKYTCIIYQKLNWLVIYYFQRLTKAEMKREVAEYFVSSFTDKEF